MKSYVCKCGKEFNNPQSFNGHKAHCYIHLAACNKLAMLQDAYKLGYIKSRETYNKNQQEKQLVKIAESSAELQDWLLEKHQCESCGKIMQEKFGSGRFCSRSCANRRSLTAEQKASISHTLIQKPKSEDRVCYEPNPNHCAVCGAILSYSSRYHKTCSVGCKNIYTAQKLKDLSKDRKAIYGHNITGRHIVYKIISDIDSRYYIGVRKCADDSLDSYLGSGIIIKRLVKKYGKEHFKRLTLFEFSCSKDAFEKEKEVITSCNGDPNCINIASGGQGGFTHSKELEYNLAPKTCVICSAVIPYSLRKRKTCSDACYKQLQSKNRLLRNK